ncbi:hypothetical protein ACR6C2_30105 [Streptomyces sp. INA 01156]
MSAAAGDVFPYPAGPGGTVPPSTADCSPRNPSPGYAWPTGELYLVTRDSDVRTVLTDPVFSRYAAAVLPGKGFGRGRAPGSSTSTRRSTPSCAVRSSRRSAPAGWRAGARASRRSPGSCCPGWATSRARWTS